MKELGPGDVSVKESFDLEAARAWRLPPSVSFAVEGATRKGDVVEVTGWLSNSAAAPETIVVFPAGPLGFFAEPAPASAVKLPPPPGGPPRPPPVPPPPEWVTLPAESRVKVTTSFRLSEWQWKSGAPRELEWSFLFWNEPKPRGRLPVPE